MKQDPDDLKPPHDSVESLMAAFRQAWINLLKSRDNNQTI